MKKARLLIVILVIVFALTACGKPSNGDDFDKNEGGDNDLVASKVMRNLRSYDDFLYDFNGFVSISPDITIYQQIDVPLDEGGVCHPFTIVIDGLDGIYSLSIYVNPDSYITHVSITTAMKPYGNSLFALFSYYVYSSMGFPEIEADDFYKQYDLLSTEDVFETDTYEDYDITSMTVGAEYISFFISLSDTR